RPPSVQPCATAAAGLTRQRQGHGRQCPTRRGGRLGQRKEERCCQTRAESDEAAYDLWVFATDEVRIDPFVVPADFADIPDGFVAHNESGREATILFWKDNRFVRVRVVSMAGDATELAGSIGVSQYDKL
ncbi:MAG: hypothetical protein ACRD0U_02385, partial [Acidimicrobiales bacterium]